MYNAINKRTIKQIENEASEEKEREKINKTPN